MKRSLIIIIAIYLSGCTAHSDATMRENETAPGTETTTPPTIDPATPDPITPTCGTKTTEFEHTMQLEYNVDAGGYGAGSTSIINRSYEQTHNQAITIQTNWTVDVQDRPELVFRFRDAQGHDIENMIATDTLDWTIDIHTVDQATTWILSIEPSTNALPVAAVFRADFAFKITEDSCDT